MNLERRVDGQRPRLLVCIGEYVACAGQTRVVASELSVLRDTYEITLASPKIEAAVPEGVAVRAIPMYSLRGVFRLVRLMRSADVIHLHDTLVHMIIGTTIRRSRCLITCHGIAPPQIRTGLRQKIKGHITMYAYPLLYRRAAAVASCSEFIGNWLRDVGVERLSVIPLGAPDRVVPQAERPGGRRLVYVGEVSYRKGVDLLLQALAGCPGDVVVDIVGTGDLAWAKELADKGGVADRAVLHGPVDDAATASLMDNALAVVSFSRWEGFGLPIVEGFAHRRPAIVLDGSAMAEIVSQAKGGVVLAGPEGLADAVEQISERWAELSANAAEEATVLRWSMTWARYDELLRNLMVAGPRARARSSGRRGSVGRQANALVRRIAGKGLDRALWRLGGNSSKFWDLHYRAGGTSGPGSLGRLRSYKAEFINEFVADHGIRDVIEFGCGNGDQLVEAQYPRYIGLDVSDSVVRKVMARFAHDATKSFFVYVPAAYRDNARIFRSELALSLDVVFHLVEDDIYTKYIEDLFTASTRWVIVYSSNENDPSTDVRYTRHRRFTDDVERLGGWDLTYVAPNPLAEHTRSQFFVFEKASTTGC